MKRFVFATNNPHKLEEVKAIIGTKIEILSLKDIGCHADTRRECLAESKIHLRKVSV